MAIWDERTGDTGVVGLPLALTVTDHGNSVCQTGQSHRLALARPDLTSMLTRTSKPATMVAARRPRVSMLSVARYAVVPNPGANMHSTVCDAMAQAAG